MQRVALDAQPVHFSAPSAAHAVIPRCLDRSKGSLLSLDTQHGVDAGRTSEETATPALHRIPESPSSLWLGLTALASFGLYHASQSIRRAHVPLMAEWYHTGGPEQIGHATPLDLDTRDLPACALDCFAPQVYRTPLLHLEILAVPILEIPHLATSPRAPPLL